MSATLYFSNAAGILLDQLANHVRQGDPFVAPRIATPTPALRRMVQMGLAERLGAAANLGFVLLEKALWDCLADLDNHRLVAERQPARLLDQAALQSLLLAQILGHPPEAAAQYLGLSAFMERNGGPIEVIHPVNPDLAPRGTSPATWRKAIQLAGRLAHLFREYEYSRVREHGREGLTSLWLKGSPCFVGYLDATSSDSVRQRVNALEAWQSELYRQVFGTEGLRDAWGKKTGVYLYTLPQYSEMVFAQNRESQKDAARIQAAPSQTLDLFGLAHVSPFHRSLIQRLSDSQATGGKPTHFRIYALNPCSEYWEDALDTRTRRRRLQQDLLRQEKFVTWRHLSLAEKEKLHLKREALWAEFLKADSNENTLLASWGVVGRENIQLWCQVTDYAFAGRFREPENQTLLASVQSALLHRSGPLPDEERTQQDGSLRIFAAPEIHREIEAIRADMLTRMANDAQLRPDDMAILLTNAETYGPAIDIVLGALAQDENNYVPYVRPEAGLRTSDPYLRGLLTLATMAQGEFDRPQLLALLENPRCQTRLGLDMATAESLSLAVENLNLFQGDGIAVKTPDPHRFLTGMRRLLLGLCMDASGNEKGTSYLGYLPYTHPTMDRDAIAAFSDLLTGLQDALAPFHANQNQDMVAWAKAFSAMTQVALLPDATQAAEVSLERKLVNWYHELKRFDDASALVHDSIPKACPKELFLESLRETLAAADLVGPPWLSGGVQVGSLEALRGMPFRVIYVPGLQEGDFPDEPLQNSLDLRQFRRVIGDLEPASRNRYALLMALTQTREAVVFSYVDRDLEKDQSQQRSSVLGELIGYIESDILPAKAGKPGCFRSISVSLNPPEAKAMVAPQSIASPLASTMVTAGENQIPAMQTMDYEELVRYLKNPSLQTLSWRLRINNPFETESELREPYATPNALLQDLPWLCLAEAAHEGPGFSLADSLDKHLKALTLHGALPPGRFGEPSREHLRDAVTTWWNTLGETLGSDWGDARWSALQSARIGEVWPKRPNLPRMDIPSVILSGITWGGYQPFLWKRTGGGIGLLVKAYGRVTWGQMLKPFVWACLTSLTDSPLKTWLASGPLDIWAIAPAGETKNPKQYQITIEASQARAWLASMAERICQDRATLGTALGPPLKAWENLVQLGKESFPWDQDHIKQDLFCRQVERRVAMSQAEPNPGKSPLAEVDGLLPRVPIANALQWAQQGFGLMLRSTRAITKKSK